MKIQGATGNNPYISKLAGSHEVNPVNTQKEESSGTQAVQQPQDNSGAQGVQAPERADELSNISTEGFTKLLSAVSTGNFDVEGGTSNPQKQDGETAEFVDTLRKLTELIDPERIEQKIVESLLETMNEVAKANEQ